MTAMKLTPNAAMRARDVSRPRAEHLAEAEAAEVRGEARGAKAQGAKARGGTGRGTARRHGAGGDAAAWRRAGHLRGSPGTT